MKGLVLLFSLLMGSALAQSTMNPYVKIMGATGLFHIYQSYGISTIDATLAAGVHFNDHFSFQAGVNNTTCCGQLNVVSLSISPYYRILKSKYPVSPVIGIDAGTQVWSNANNRFIQAGSGSNTRYNRMLFFGKAKLLADFKIKSSNFNLMVGPTFNLIYFRIDKVLEFYNDYMVIGGYISDNYGVGFELSLMYTFPMKKGKLKIRMLVINMIRK